MFLYVHRNRRLIKDGSQGRPPRLSHSSRVLGHRVAVNIHVCLLKYDERCPKEEESDREGSLLFRLHSDNGMAFDWLIQAEVTTQPVPLRPLTAAATMAIDCHCRRRVRAVTAVSWKRLIPLIHIQTLVSSGDRWVTQWSCAEETSVAIECNTSLRETFLF